LELLRLYFIIFLTDTKLLDSPVGLIFLKAAVQRFYSRLFHEDRYQYRPSAEAVPFHCLFLVKISIIGYNNKNHSEDKKTGHEIKIVKCWGHDHDKEKRKK
jgi:hypothetical protein